jgi:hypothetical protein
MLDKAFNALSSEQKVLLKSEQARNAIRLVRSRACYASAIYAGLITEGSRAILTLGENTGRLSENSFFFKCGSCPSRTTS